jgi:hypothetical protein
MTTESVFRGMRGIEEVTQKMKKLVEFYRLHKPRVTTITLARVDYDLIKRWPKAASACGFDVTHNGVFYKGYELRFAAGAPRYSPKDEDRGTQSVR